MATKVTKTFKSQEKKFLTDLIQERLATLAGTTPARVFSAYNYINYSVGSYFDTLAKDIEKSIRADYESTFEAWKGQNTAINARRKFKSYPTIDVIVNTRFRFNMSTFVLRAFIDSLVVDENKNPHPIWYTRDRGIKPTYFRNGSTPFAIDDTIGRRTNYRSLRVETFDRKDVYEDASFWPKGSTRPRIEGTEWSDIIGRNARRDLRALEGWDFKRYSIQEVEFDY